MKLTFYHDGGHGWVRVTNKQIKKFGFASEISSCSYMTQNHTFLEEDGDAGLLIKHLEAKGISYEFKNVYSDYSSIRSYRTFSEDFLDGIKVGDSIELAQHGTFKVTGEKKGRWILDGGLWAVSKRTAYKMLLSIA